LANVTYNTASAMISGLSVLLLCAFAHGVRVTLHSYQFGAIIHDQEEKSFPTPCVGGIFAGVW